MLEGSEGRLERGLRLLGLDSGAGGTSVVVPPRPRTRRPAFELPTGSGWPPEPPARDDGFGGGGDGDDGGDRPFGEGGPADVSAFALRLVLAVVTILFAVSLGVWLLLLRREPWAGADAVRFSSTIWLGTFLLLASSGTLKQAVALARERRRGVRAWLGGSLLLGLGFLGAQAMLWLELSAAGALPSTSGYGAIFYLVTGLHALHFLVGLGYLAWFLPPSHGPSLDSLRLGAGYWHFLTAIWVVLFLVLFFLR